MTLEERITDLVQAIGTDIKNLNIAISSLGGGSLYAEIEVDLGTVAQDSGSFLITGLTGLTAGKTVQVIQAAGPYTGKGDLADEAEEIVLANGVVVNATSVQVFWSGINNSSISGNVKFLYKILN